MSRKHTYIVLPLLLLLNACSTTTPGSHQAPLTGPAPVEKQVVIPEMDEESRFAELERLENEGYLPPTLGRGDVLDISVYDEPDLTIEEIPIRPDGRISFPLIGRRSGRRPDRQRIEPGHYRGSGALFTHT